MTEAWRSYRSAPEVGTAVCSAEAVPEGGTKTVTLESERGSFPLLLVRTSANIRAFVNACPHQYLPLDYRGSRLLSADGRIVRCTNHSAGFCATTGIGVEGLGTGAQLDPVPVSIDVSGQIVIGGSGEED
jgi:nitrite reductase/ring-hydroxylating ferredoxin subunit